MTKVRRARLLHATLAVALTFAFTVTGCVSQEESVPQPGINTPHDGLSAKSKTQLLDETLTRVDDIVQLVGGEWLDSGIPPSVFKRIDPEQRDKWYRGPCNEEGTARQYSVDVWQNADESSEFDPDALTEKVRSHWQGLGYRVRQIGPTAKDSTGHRSIIVDLPHSASISFSANTKILGVSASSECVKWD